MREPETALRIGTNVWIGSEPLYLARELGQLDPAVVQLVEYPSASEVLRAFRNQAIDGMVISLDELFGLAADGLAAAGHPGRGHVPRRRCGRRPSRHAAMQDLKGKPVAVESGALGAFVLSRALALEGMQASDVNVVHLESNEQPKAYQKGEVDGAVTFDPYPHAVAAGRREDAVRQHPDPGRDSRSSSRCARRCSRSSRRRSRRCSPAGSARSII